MTGPRPDEARIGHPARVRLLRSCDRGRSPRHRGYEGVATTVVTYEEPVVVDGDRVRWVGSLAGSGHAAEVSFTFTCPDPAGFEPTGRTFLLAFLVPAMRLGQPLVIEGPVDDGTLAGLMEWQEATVSWHPDLRVVPIRAEAARHRPVPDGAGGITAFSGGVDSCFTVVRHTAEHDDATGPAYRAGPLDAALMVHGFDIPVGELDVFESAFARSRRILDSAGVTAYRLQTDLRSLEAPFGCDWSAVAHGIWLVASLSCLEQWVGHTLVPSSFPYDRAELPWGSNPMTDPLLAAGDRPLWHDGAAHLKLSKVGAIAHHPGVQRDLRVCWEGFPQDRNCGRCFKCMTTQACFWLHGVEDPACFHDPCTEDDLATVSLADHHYKVVLAEAMLDEARRQDRGRLAAALEVAIAAATEQPAPARPRVERLRRIRRGPAVR
jgi:hypothetical protein